MAFARQAKAFEALPMNGVRRRGGFARYAPAVLPVGKKGKAEFPAVWRERTYVKEAIAEMSNGHCAYCQSEVRGNQAGHVEHFRPKSLFPTLAYEWKNYFLGCEQCNLRKGDRWPAAGGYVAPDRGDPSRRFVFDEHGSMRPRAGDDDAAATWEDLQLDRPSLRKARRTAIKNKLKGLDSIIAVMRKLGRKSGLKMEDLLNEELSPFSAAINANVRRVWHEAWRK